MSELSAQLDVVTKETEAVKMLLSDSEEAVLRCERTNLEDRAAHLVSVSLLEEQILVVKMDCESKEVIVAELRSILLDHEKTEMSLKSQITNLMTQLEETMRREEQQIALNKISEHLLKEQSKRKPWFLFFWPF